MLTNIVGYALKTAVTFGPAGRLQHYARGAFARDLDAPVVLGIDHQACPPPAGIVVPELAIATSAAQTLRIEEDAYGLFFTAAIRSDACVSYGDGVPINIVAAIADGVITTVSMVGRPLEHVKGRAGIPADVAVFSRARLKEISLLIEVPPASPGTWVMLDGDAARAKRDACLKEPNQCHS